MNNIIKNIEAAQLKAEVTPFNVGDTVKLYAKVKEEIDADAYACLYVEKYLGISDGTTFMYDSAEDAAFGKDYTQKIKERMKNINI